MKVVKRRGHLEEFDERKVYASVYAACINVHRQQEEAEIVAEKVTREIVKWLEKKSEITSERIYDRVVTELERLNMNAAYMYSTHRDLS